MADHSVILGYNRVNLMEAIKGTGHAYYEIGKLFDEECKLDWEPLGDMLHMYKGVISAFPDILTIHKVSFSCFFKPLFYPQCTW